MVTHSSAPSPVSPLPATATAFCRLAAIAARVRRARNGEERRRTVWRCSVGVGKFYTARAPQTATVRIRDRRPPHSDFAALPSPARTRSLCHFGGERGRLRMRRVGIFIHAPGRILGVKHCDRRIFLPDVANAVKRDVGNLYTPITAGALL